jgi:hypothetical protein
LEKELSNDKIRLKAFVTAQRRVCGRLDLNVACLLCKDFRLIQKEYLKRELVYYYKEHARLVNEENISQLCDKEAENIKALIAIKQDCG